MKARFITRLEPDVLDWLRSKSSAELHHILRRAMLRDKLKRPKPPLTGVKKPPLPKIPSSPHTP